MYCQYVTGKCGAAVVIFDGYKQSSTKYMTHQERTGEQTATPVTFSYGMRLTMKRDHFLCNSSNKQSFNNILSRYLWSVAKHITHKQMLIWKRKEGEHCSRGGRHWSPYFTVLLLRNERWRIIFSAKAKGKFNKTTCLEHESSEGEARSRRVQQHFLHPCNTRMWYYFSPGKRTSLKKFCVNHHFCNQAKVFNNTSASKNEVIEAGEKALVCLYNGKSGETLDCFTHRRYCQKVATNTSQVQPHAELETYFGRSNLSQFTCILSDPTMEASWWNHVDGRMGVEILWGIVGSCHDPPTSSTWSTASHYQVQLFHRLQQPQVLLRKEQPRMFTRLRSGQRLSLH